MQYNKIKLALLAAVLGTSLMGCSGEDGEQGAAGTNGTNGTDGTNGIDGQNGLDGANAPVAFTKQLIARAVLNTSSPEGAAEIVGFQKSTGWVYAINSSQSPATIEVMDLNGVDSSALTLDAEGIVSNTNLTVALTINLDDDSGANLSGDANSLAIDDNNNVLAVAVDSGTTGVAGHVAFYDISGDAPVWIKNVEAGFLPDNVVFTHDGAKAIVANEGEPSKDYLTDPVGSISVISLTDGVPSDTAIHIALKNADDTQFDQTDLESQGAKFSNPTGLTIDGQVRTYTVEQDLEPEYIAVSEDNTMAYVSMQENNALGIINLADNSIKVIGLGYKDWSGLHIDVSDKDGGLQFKQYQHLMGLYQPDTIASYSWNGANFIVTANEGDGREYIEFENDDVTEDAGKTECTSKFPDGGVTGIYEWEADEDDDGNELTTGTEICIAYTDESRAKDLEDYGTVATELSDYIADNGGKNGLGRLLVTNTIKNTDDEYDTLYAYGARSFTIWDANGLVVFDTGDDFERITASVHGEAFNNDEDENSGDTRSDAKGPEPEALALGQIEGRTYAFVGLERMGGIFIYDITNPYKASFVDYFYNRGTSEGEDITGDLAPEGMKFVAAEDSPTGKPLLIVGNEISGSVAVWQVEPK
jgi:hypothetical protein